MPGLGLDFDGHGVPLDGDDDTPPVRVGVRDCAAGPIGLEFFELRPAVPDLSDDKGAVVFDPGRGAGERMLQTTNVGLPVAEVEVEIVLAVAQGWLWRNRRRRWVQLIMYPGLQLQRLTTREPDLDQLAVSIASMKAVLAAEGEDLLSAADLVGVELVA